MVSIEEEEVEHVRGGGVRCVWRGNKKVGEERK